MRLAQAALAVSFAAAASSHAHPGHGAALAVAATAATTASSDATTGSGDLRFRYRADLSELPERIAAGIKKAHGGFAKAPDGSLYFGLKGLGVIHLSADLREKTVVADSEALADGGLHNTTYVDRDGGMLALPDNERGAVHFLKTDGTPVGDLGRPAVNDYYKDKSKAYNPTDTEVGPDGTFYICDGYSPGKYVLTADLDAMRFNDFHFGGNVGGPGRKEGRFSTNHGITLGPSNEDFYIADRERQWVQQMTPKGDFVAGHDMQGANPCDVDFVEHDGETLMVVGCLVGPDKSPGVVQIVRDGEVVSTLKPKEDLGIEPFQHIHNAAGVVVDGKLYVLCYGWNPGCYAVLEHVAE